MRRRGVRNEKFFLIDFGSWRPRFIWNLNVHFSFTFPVCMGQKTRRFFKVNTHQIAQRPVHCKKWLEVFPSPVGMSLTSYWRSGKDIAAPKQGKVPPPPKYEGAAPVRSICLSSLWTSLPLLCLSSVRPCSNPPPPRHNTTTLPLSLHSLPFTVH
jgi:hypothetical protein